MRVGTELKSCAYNTSITAAVANANTEATGYLAVSVIPGGTTDNNIANPTPRVRLTSSATDQIYGALVTFNPATQRCGIQTTGIVPIRKNAASVAADVGIGIIGSSTAGQVAGSATAGTGRGVVVARNENRLFVDLDASVNATS